MTCNHRGCRCTEIVVEQSGKFFCSERCAELESAGPKTDVCNCGHPDCAAV